MPYLEISSPIAVQVAACEVQLSQIAMSLEQSAVSHQTKWDILRQQLDKERRRRPEVLQLVIEPIKELEEKAWSLQSEAPEKSKALLQLANQFQQAANDYFADPDAQKAKQLFHNCQRQADSCTAIDEIRCTELERTIYRILLAIGVALSMGSLCLSSAIRGTLFYDATETRTKVNDVLQTISEIEQLSLKVF